MEAQAVTPVAPLGAAFRINDVLALEATIVAAGRIDDTVVLTVELEPEAWETADLWMLFHLDWDARHDGTVSGTRPVQVELRLDAGAAGDDTLPDDPAGLAAAVAAAPDSSALRTHGSWYALAVTEPVDLPPGLAGKGEVRSGFTTTWADAP